MAQRMTNSLYCPELPARSREGIVKSASAYAELQWEQQHRQEGGPRNPQRNPPPESSYVPQPDYMDADEDDDLIKPKKLVNPVKASKSHQDLHRELLLSYKRTRDRGIKTRRHHAAETLKESRLSPRLKTASPPYSRFLSPKPPSASSSTIGFKSAQHIQLLV
ncbi:uncharacterized protein ACJ7VT_003323 isoform 2-T2 [Polymixia lowei]